MKPGMRYRELGEIISRHADTNGFSVVKSYCGHGIGDLFHCAPSIPHYAANKAKGVIKAGQTFTIEPMINAGKFIHLLDLRHNGCSHTLGRLSAISWPHAQPHGGAGKWKDLTWPDQWTSVTQDGSRSAQFEHTLLVTDSGCEVLTARLPASPPLWWQVSEGDAAQA